MTRPIPAGYVAECFWSGVREGDLPELDRRVGACVAEYGDSTQPAGTSVRYLGSMLIVDDEVVLCLFEGSIATVRRVAERAEVPYERILRGTGAPWSWPSPPSPERKIFDETDTTRGGHGGARRGLGRLPLRSPDGEQAATGHPTRTGRSDRHSVRDTVGDTERDTDRDRHVGVYHGQPMRARDRAGGVHADRCVVRPRNARSRLQRLTTLRLRRPDEARLRGDLRPGHIRRGGGCVRRHASCAGAR